MGTESKRRCVTCQKEFPDGPAEIQSKLSQFDDWCICKACVLAYRKPVKQESKCRPEPTERQRPRA